MTTYIKGKKIDISVYFAVVITLIFSVSPHGYAPAGFICCLLHEAGHFVAMKCVDCKVRGISFGIYGMRIDCASNATISFKKEMLIALGGPLVNCLLVAAGLLLKDDALTISNVALCVFNLLPVESTDGYTALKSLLIMHFEEEKIKAALRIVSAAFLFLLYCFGFLLLFKSRYNFSALSVAIYLTIKFLFQENQLCR